MHLKCSKRVILEDDDEIGIEEASESQVKKRKCYVQPIDYIQILSTFVQQTGVVLVLKRARFKFHSKKRKLTENYYKMLIS